MTWTDRLNAAVPRVSLDGLVVDVYEWAHWAAEVVNPPHRHTYFEVCWMEGGHGSLTAADRTYPLRAGDLLFIRPGVRHRIVSAQPPGLRLSWVAFGLSLGPQNGELTGLFAAFARTELALARDDGQVAAVWEALRAAAAGPPRRGQRDQLAALATALLLGLARAGAGELPALPEVQPPDRGGRAVRQAVRYIHDNLDRPLRVGELARHVHVSPRQLNRLFAAHAGASPAAYVERVRLDRAAALLVRTATPIKQVAAAVGYPSVAPFTRAFARRHGQPPGRFRDAGDLSGVLAVPAGELATWPDPSSRWPVAVTTAG